MSKKEYNLEEYDEFYKETTERIKNIINNEVEQEEIDFYYKVLNKLEDINIGIEILRNKNAKKSKKEYSIDDFKEYYKAPADMIKNIKKNNLDDNSLTDFCDSILEDLENIDTIQQYLIRKIKW